MTKKGWATAASKTWLFGSLMLAGRRSFSAALYEFSYLFLWSILSFVLGGLVQYVIVEPSVSSKSYYDLAIGTFRNGELLVFTISMLAPTLYLVLHDPEGAKSHFPHKLPLSTIVMFVMVVCAALFSLQKANTVQDADAVFAISVIFTGLGLCIRYLAMVYHRIRLPDYMPETELRANEHSFVEQYKKHAGDV